MKKVFQTQTGKRGNCLKSCIASILECSIKDLPIVRGPMWIRRYQKFLAPYGLSMVWTPHKGSNRFPPGYVIAIRGVQGKKYDHAVVYLDGKLVHDPYPYEDCARLLRIKYWIVFTVLDPSVQTRAGLAR